MFASAAGACDIGFDFTCRLPGGTCSPLWVLSAQGQRTNPLRREKARGSAERTAGAVWLGEADNRRSAQLVEQRFGVLQIGSVEAFGEPAIDRCQEVARCEALALVAPQPRETRCGAQFPGLGRHLPRQRDRGAEIGFGEFLLALLA